MIFIFEKNYKKIEIKNFRKFKHMLIDDLSTINVFFGSNNLGKTTILEAIFLHSCGLNIGAFFNGIFLNRQNGNFMGPYDYGEAILNLFNNYHSNPKKLLIFIESENYNKEKNETVFEFNYSTFLSPFFGGQSGPLRLFENKPMIIAEKNNINRTYFGKIKITLNNTESSFDITLPTYFENIKPLKMAIYHDLLNHRDPIKETVLYGALKRAEKLEEFTIKLRDVFPNIKSIDNIPLPDGSSKIYVYTKDRKIPLSVFGDGFRKLYYLIGNIVLHREAVHLIEELDTNFHPESIPILAKSLLKYSKEYNNQLFITSHNQEFLEIFLENLSENELKYDIRVFTLKEHDRKLRLLKLTGLEALRNIQEFHLELR
ncbi:hypothetical protein BG95_04265 [Thermosipho sp. 1063]|uniref:AAA family ATPase n=1 Tax=unclassified Thermosipho (in: thermotogales) TaxID=2676525 RepID=UPI0009494809|nr:MULTISPECIES: AAA family ATPase [unclassified Thermosipho (in: thermotogales)]ANQ54621.1 hypothetical protein Y592_04335 [Thermosipho sp. 1070]APT73036.1 hypothetical protein BG95_04265 [Thermosipho sp. 1063]OOC43854.1 hypothetical protein XO08_04160 [Thermosipho sp. 1074]